MCRNRQYKHLSREHLIAQVVARNGCHVDDLLYKFKQHVVFIQLFICSRLVDKPIQRHTIIALRNTLQQKTGMPTS